MEGIFHNFDMKKVITIIYDLIAEQSNMIFELEIEEKEAEPV